MNNLFRDASVSFAILLAAMSGRALAQSPGRGGFGPSPEMQAAAKAQTESATSQMHAYLNDIGYKMLAERAKRVAAIETKEQAVARRDEVRRRIVELVGGIPATTGPVNAKSFDSIKEDGFTIENIAYESCPNYWVTANVYVPDGKGPFPAMIIAPGHGAGKASQYTWSANFARAGVLVLSIDPMGQGERMQHWDDELGRSKLEGSGDHEHANQTALLIGHHIARYWFADGIRGVDYLIARPDVIADRIGTFGCSGGGTAAAYLAAMEPRIRVAAAASYITSFKELLPGNGPQDAEQTLPSFIADGLDFADWVELAAPRPFAIVAFEKDFFPIDGAKWTFAEAQRIYSLYGMEKNLRLIHGQGGHCNLGPVTDQLMAFLMSHLFPAEKIAVKRFQQLRPTNLDRLTVTPTGQVSTSLNSLTVEAIARRDAAKLMANAQVIADQDSLSQLQSKVRADVRRLAGVTADEKQLPKVTSSPLKQADGYRTESLKIESEPGIVLHGVLGIPRPAALTRRSCGWIRLRSRRFRKAPSSSAWCGRGISSWRFIPATCSGSRRAAPSNLHWGSTCRNCCERSWWARRSSGCASTTSCGSSIGSVAAMTSIGSRSRSMEKAAWGWRRSMPPPSMSVSDGSSSRTASCPIARRWKPASTRTSPRRSSPAC